MDRHGDVVAYAIWSRVKRFFFRDTKGNCISWSKVDGCVSIGCCVVIIITWDVYPCCCWNEACFIFLFHLNQRYSMPEKVLNSIRIHFTCQSELWICHDKRSYHSVWDVLLSLPLSSAVNTEQLYNSDSCRYVFTAEFNVCLCSME
jgi:hypothetical protein